MRFARPLVVAVLVLLFAVTPLSALVAPGEFEVRFKATASSSSYWQPYEFAVRLADRTGLARGLAPAASVRGNVAPVINYGADGRILIVSIEGSSCDYLTHLTFERIVDGFRIRERTDGLNCGIRTGSTHEVAIQLWAPVDAATVEYVPDLTE